MSKRSFPYVWASWASKLLGGDNQCMYTAWMKTQYQDYAKTSEDAEGAARLEEWKAAHTDMMRQRKERLASEGWSVYFEDRNKFIAKGATANLAGNPDLVVVRDMPEVEPEAVIEDGKTGKRRSGDHWQVILYMVYAPKKLDHLKGMTPSGRIIYKDGIHEIPASAANDSARQRIGELVRRLANPTPPPKTPSAFECARCDVLMCEERVKEQSVEFDTEDF